MSDYIFYTWAGMTDPMRDDFDGPIIHIVRHYRPKKVYLALTQEVGEYEENTGCYSRAIELTDNQCEIVKDFTGIKKAHDFNVYSDKMIKDLIKIAGDNPQDTILVNVTSGTPQMQLNLCLAIVALNLPLIAVQVATPTKKGNPKIAHFDHMEDNVEYGYENLWDNLEETPSRCNEVDMELFNHAMLKSQVVGLIKNYDYDGACKLLEQYPFIFNDRVRLLVKHARERLNISFEEAAKISRELQLEDELYPIKDNTVKELSDFYVTMCIKQLRGELNDFILRLTPLSDRISFAMLDKTFKISLNSICEYNKRTGRYKLNKSKAEESLPGINAYMDQAFSEPFRWGMDINFISVMKIMGFLIESGAHNDQKETYKELEKWGIVAAKLRNPLAHTILDVKEEDIKEYYEADSKKLVNNINRIFVNLFKGSYKQNIVYIYDKINEMIIKEMDQ